MAKKVELGRVTKIFDSGVVLTDKEQKAIIKGVEIGDRLVWSKNDRKVEIIKDEEEIGIEESEYAGLDALALADKFTVVELKKIAKQKGLKGFGNLNQADLCNLIVTGELPKIGDE
jgi:hypothetical protein